jgi:Mg/Co/Ni transporter MgtE
MVFQLKGSTSIPKVTDAITKKNAGKKLNFCECVITDQATELEKEIKEAELELDKPSVALRDFISEKIAKINKQIAEANKKLNIYKFATILNNDWIHGLEEKDGAYTYSDGEYTLNVRVDRITNYY